MEPLEPLSSKECPAAAFLGENPLDKWHEILYRIARDQVHALLL
jgi:hypothetical protein